MVAGEETTRLIFSPMGMIVSHTLPERALLFFHFPQTKKQLTC